MQHEQLTGQIDTCELTSDAERDHVDARGIDVVGGDDPSRENDESVTIRVARLALAR